MGVASAIWSQARGASGVRADEAELLRRCLRADNDAREALVRRYQRTVYRLAYSLLGHPEEATDAAQDALVAMLQSLRSFRGEASFETWLKRLTTNVCLTHRRRARVRAPWNQPEEEVEQVAPGPSPESVALRHEVQAAVREQVRRLPSDYRAVVVLRDIHGLSYSEITEILRVPVGTVKSRLCRGRRMLRLAIEDDERIPTPTRGERS